MWDYEQLASGPIPTHSLVPSPEKCQLLLLWHERFVLRKCACLLFKSLSCMENNYLPNRKGKWNKTWVNLSLGPSTHPARRLSRPKRPQHSNPILSCYHLAPSPWRTVAPSSQKTVIPSPPPWNCGAAHQILSNVTTTPSSEQPKAP